MFTKSYKCSVLITLYLSVSSQTDVNEATNLSKNLQRSKRNPQYQWTWLYLPETQQAGIGPPVDQYNVFNQNNHNAFDQFAAASSYNNDEYNPLNYDQIQAKRHVNVKHGHQGPFAFIPDYTTPVHNILKNIPGYNWVESNNPGSTYTTVIEGGQNPLRDIFNVVFGPEQTDRILQTGQATPIQTQTPQQSNYFNNNYDYQSPENANDNHQLNDIQIQPSVTEVLGANSGSVYNTQYNMPNNNNQPQSFPQAQYGVSQQSASNAQSQTASLQPTHKQGSYGSNSQQTHSFSQQADTLSIPTQTQLDSVQFEGYPESDQQQLNNAQNQNYNRPSPTHTVQDDSQFQFSLPAQSSYIPTSIQQSATSGLQGQQTNYNVPNQPGPQQNNQQEVKYKVLYQTTTTTKPIAATRPSSPASNIPQKSTEGGISTNKVKPQASRPSTSYPVTQTVINSGNLQYTNVNLDMTTRRVTDAPYLTSPKFIEENQVSNNISPQKPDATEKDDDDGGVNFRKDALEFYGTKVQNVSYAALPNTTNEKNPTPARPVQVKTENRFGINSGSANQVPTTRKPTKKCEAPTSPPIPDFNKPGRRISQIKCYEYIWQHQERVSKWNAKKECHRSQNEMIYIAGKEAIPAEYPHMAAIGWSGNSGSWIFKCAGALISPKFVLTAAHCTKTPSKDTSVIHAIPQIVRLGDRDVAEPIRVGTISVDVNIQRIITYPEYSPPSKYNDIALIELQKAITFTRHVQPACLWSNPDTSKLGKHFIATGWGVVDTALRNNPTPPLQRIAVDTIDTDSCNGFIKSYCNRNWCGVSNREVCGTSLNGSLDICQGDSGAPLQKKIPLPSDSEGSMHYVIAVTSFKIGCEESDLPVVYTKVSNFIDWIENVVWTSNS